ncbi:eukaryotic translation initiation factor 3 subunit A [Senna tora]|uniref:Eukaryotic translation initiation factor 3 subunit A n=1 Tax=Senna tora TaxID=362788 RepID=A0A834TA13_9FABA|nr:eukaryotic translation initiation factor 3 subunit A [Senna tora]
MDDRFISRLRNPPATAGPDVDHSNALMHGSQGKSVVKMDDRFTTAKDSEIVNNVQFLLKKPFNPLKTPKASLMVVYYAKLTEIFWISSSYLYHAYAWFKLFLLHKSFNPNLSQKDLQLIASSVVLAALSVPPYDHTCGAFQMELEHAKEKNLRMANLIGFNLENKPESRQVLSRSSLLSELEVKDIYHLLEHEFPSLDLALKEELSALRLIQQVSNVYQTMKIETLSGMIPFF